MATPRPSKTQTPVMRQFFAAKEQHPDALLFFRMGDFYELFFDDAITAARALDLKLTTRDRNDPDPTPMCGVPHHAAQGYLARLLELGHCVALCEQMEDPAQAKGIVKRSVVRVLTPALVADPESLDPRAHRFLATVVPPIGGPLAPGAWGVAAYDLSTAEMFAGECSDTASLTGQLARLDARELLVPADAMEALRPLARILPRLFVRTLPATLDASNALATLAAAFGDRALDALLDGLPSPARQAAAVAFAYAATTQVADAPTVQRIVPLDARDHLVLDETAQQHLEVFRSSRGERKGSLIAEIDRTVTAMGARRLRTWLAFPLMDLRRIRKRQDAVECFVTTPEARGVVREKLGSIGDVERIGVRAKLGLVTPRDLGGLRDSLERVPTLIALLDPLGAPVRQLVPNADTAPLAHLLTAALSDAPPNVLGEGSVFRPGYDAQLDEFAALASGAREEMAAIETRERERTKIASLKVSYNRIFGFYIEVTKPNLKLVPSDYKRKQTVAGGERFITEELSELEHRILGAEESLRAREAERWRELVGEVAARLPALSALSSVIADLDAVTSFAETAHRHDHVRPVVDDSTVTELLGARHPVVESALEPGAFVPNDVKLDARGERLLLVTGPNMAGKSTLMRQVALCVLLAQAGAFVPASSARLGVVDRIYTRVGASDDLARGDSTFMVEMRETATILKGATSKSLVVLDEIGRGTSTYDGLAIAWSVAEYLHDVVKCRALFATHYHELCLLGEQRPHAANVSVSARETGDDIVFLHKLQAGGASRSFGIAVARLAGLPEMVVSRARLLLRDLERGEGPGARTRQIGLFEAKPDAPLHPALDALAHAEIERMTPLEALHFLARLKEMKA